MTDPFYEKYNDKVNAQNAWNKQVNAWQNINNQTVNQWDNQEVNSNMEKEKIALQKEVEEKLKQQKQIEDNFVKLKQAYSNFAGDQEKQEQIKQKMLELKKVYQDNQAFIEQNQAVSVQKINTKKNGNNKRMSSKTLMLWCGFFAVLLLWGLFFIFYYLVQNPSQLVSVWIDASTAKNLLQVFASVFFGIIMVAGFILLVVNIYRLFSVKNKSKLWYIGGSFLGFIILLGALFLGSRILNTINNISIDEIMNNTNIVRPYMELKNGSQYILSMTNPIMIAPIKINFWLNSKLFNSSVVPVIWGNATVTSVSLLCGNWQELAYNSQTDFFVWSCFYRKKWEYPIQLSVGYLDGSSGEQKIQIVDVRNNFPIISEVKILKDWVDVDSNDNEILAWVVPSRLTFDASDVFVDLQLSDYDISWDLDWDGNFDREWETSVSNEYLIANVYNLTFRIPWMNDFLYTFPLRTEQSDVPVWKIEYRETTNNNYYFNISFVEQNKSIDNYLFEIVNDDFDSVVATIKKDTPNFDYEFNQAWSYYVKATFVTEDGKQWIIESDVLNISESDLDLDYQVKVMWPNSSQYQNTVIQSGTILIDTIPSNVRVYVSQQDLDEKNLSLSAIYNSNNIIYNWEYVEFRVNSTDGWNLKINVENEITNETNSLDLWVQVSLDNVVWRVIVSPDTVGNSPFSVTFDASTTELNNADDEIVYFNWDFGDGESINNVSESIVEHVYYYDFENENGEFKPTVSIKTRKGIEKVISDDILILVKQPIETLDIYVSSHPTQVAGIGETVQMGVEVNWMPTKVTWDFGDDQTLECAGRECVETEHMYVEPGSYTVLVTIEFEHRTALKNNIRLIVE